jgi:RNA polymerase sigma factor (TIGR02999 family)
LPPVSLVIFAGIPSHERVGVASSAKQQVTQLLVAWGDGDKSALDELIPLVEAELHSLAQRYLRREQPGHTLQTTALVNEAYLRLVDYKDMEWQNRAHFFAVSAQVMRRILVEHARNRRSLKRGGARHQVSLDDAAAIPLDRPADLVALDDALRELAALDARKHEVVELRFFGGLSVEETAEVLKVSRLTVLRDWQTAKAWLYRELNQKDDHGS